MNSQVQMFDCEFATDMFLYHPIRTNAPPSTGKATPVMKLVSS
jgi:hypothetical protein